MMASWQEARRVRWQRAIKRLDGNPVALKSEVISSGYSARSNCGAVSISGFAPVVILIFR